jgi:hypothetical protein
MRKESDEKPNICDARYIQCENAFEFHSSQQGFSNFWLV